MKVSDLLEARRANWHELEQLCTVLETTSPRKRDPRLASRFAALYRAACADLALADAYQLPPGAVHYLHQLVARAHNQLYRSRRFRFSAWTRLMLVDVPRQLYQDNYLRVAFVVFWGVFFLSAYMGASNGDFAETIAGRERLVGLEEMYSSPIAGRGTDMDLRMFGLYVLINPTIGLRCFAFGLAFGIGGLYVLVYNAALLGGMTGYMVQLPQGENYLHFITAHAPFELTAVVLSAAAGMRLGFSLVDTGGRTRAAALRETAVQAVPAMCAAVILFLLAALIEGFISAAQLPYWFKVLVAMASAGLLMFYFVMLGFPPGEAPSREP